jgi:hypothetical protein
MLVTSERVKSSEKIIEKSDLAMFDRYLLLVSLIHPRHMLYITSILPLTK